MLIHTEIFKNNIMAIQITEDWTIELGNKGSLKERLVVDTPVIQLPRDGVTNPKIVVHLRRQEYDPITNEIVKDVTDGYDIVRGRLRKYHDGTLMPKLDAQGNIVYEDDGVTPVLGRDDSYERVIYALENGLFTKQTLIDGIKEYYKID